MEAAMSNGTSLVPQRRRPAGLPADPLIGHLRPMRYRPLEFLSRCMIEVGDYADFCIPGGDRATIISSPEGVKHVLQDNARHYDKQTRSFLKLSALIGRGLITSDGEHWFRHRRLMQPAFHRQRLASFASLMARSAAALAERWEQATIADHSIDVADDMMSITLKIVGEALFSLDLSDEAGRVNAALRVAVPHVKARVTTLFDPPEWFPTLDNLRFLRARATLDNIVLEIIAQRRRGGDQPNDLLQLLLEAKDEETGESLSDEELRDEAMTLILAGHETTANALTWAFYALSQHPEIAERLSSEVQAALGGRLPGIEDLPRLEYAGMVIEEAMRLYPPVWIIMRRALRDDEIGGYWIRAGSIVMLPARNVHRNPRVWEAPERFDPERFRKERLASMPRYAHFPFGGGPRLCIGSHFAMMEAQLILATLVQRFRLTLIPRAKVELAAHVTLRPRYGMPMAVKVR